MRSEMKASSSTLHGILILVLTIGLITLSSSCQAQTKGTAKLYGFVQAVAPGANNTEGTSIDGESMGGGKAGRNYFFYVTSPSTIYPAAIYMNGQELSVRASRVTKTPVRKPNSEGTSVTLVPSTKYKVWMLTPAPAIDGKSFKRAEELASSNALVLVYKQGGKWYYATVKELKSLDPATAL